MYNHLLREPGNSIDISQLNFSSSFCASFLLSLVSLLMATCVGSAVPASLDLTLRGRFRPLKVDWLKFFRG